MQLENAVGEQHWVRWVTRNPSQNWVANRGPPPRAGEPPGCRVLECPPSQRRDKRAAPCQEPSQPEGKMGQQGAPFLKVLPGL